MKIEIDNLRRHFGRVRAVDGISFDFASGQVVGFIGPNGAGKTTTLRLLATLDEPDSGDIRIDGLSVRDEPERVRRLVGFVPDTLPAHADITVHEYLDFFARAYGLKGRAREEAVGGVKAFTRLDKLEEKPLRALSKGMKQRVSLGRALIHDPAVLIMDEPTAGLDPRARIEFRELVAILAEQGKAILVSSHILSELESLCNAVVIIELGRILNAGPIAAMAAQGRPTLALLVRASEPPESLASALRLLPGVEAARAGNTGCEVEFAGDAAGSSELLAALVRQGLHILEFRPLGRDLEDLFLSVTQGDLQ